MGEIPAVMMREAYDYEVSLWRLVPTIQMYEIRKYAPGFASFEVVTTLPGDGSEHTTFRLISTEAGHRAALRALAAMEPTKSIKKAFWDVNDMAFYGDICAKTWKGMLLAAAEEGEAG
jgi:hypothetical protein